MPTAPHNDSSVRFLFEAADIRGEMVSLDSALRAMSAVQTYSPAVRQLLGEFAAAAVLISNNLKYHGKIILQARCPGPVSLIMVECTSDSEIRGIARGDIGVTPAQPTSLLADGQLAITIERTGGSRYQGIVALEHASLAAALDNYFLQSEQLHTRFWLAAGSASAAGIMLQQLPAQLRQNAEARENQWQNAIVLAETLTAEELIDLPPQSVLHRLYHEETLRVFDPRPVQFKCSCSRERSLNALACLPVHELEEILLEQGHVSMSCEMCGAEYLYNRKDLPGLADTPVLH